MARIIMLITKGIYLSCLFMSCLEPPTCISRVESLVFRRKDPCEARVNLAVCSYLADEPTLADGPPG